MHQSTSMLLLLTSLPLLAQKSDWFEYDRSAPLDYRETLLSTRDGVRVYDSSYASPKGGRVRAYTVVPDRKGRFAGIVWQHGGGRVEIGFSRTRSRWLGQEPYRSLRTHPQTARPRRAPRPRT